MPILGFYIVNRRSWDGMERKKEQERLTNEYFSYFWGGVSEFLSTLDFFLLKFLKKKKKGLEIIEQ